jgi:hypothetical protein
MAKYKKQDIIDAVVKMRIEKMASTKTIISEFLMGQLGYGQTYSYEILKEARKEIIRLYDASNEASLEEAIGQLEELAEGARQSKNYKLAFEVRKELSKVMGHYKERIDITSGGKEITEIKLIQIKSKGDISGTDD